MTSRLNTEYDSRLVRTSVGAAGVVRPEVTPDGQLTKVYCLNCGKPGGAVSAELPPFLRNDPGVVYVCVECEASLGPLPLQAISFSHRKD